jgi:hypothetical protein
LQTETDKVIYRPGQPIQVTSHVYDDKQEETGKYRVVARLKIPAIAESRTASTSSPIVEESSLLPGGGEFAYRGKLMAPSINILKTALPGSSSTMRTQVLEITAYDQNRIAGREELDVQILNDSAEFHDLQPDPKRLQELAEISGGKVLQNSRELIKLFESLKPAKGEPVISRQPAWDRSAFWFLLLLLLAVEWIVRRYRGLA